MSSYNQQIFLINFNFNQRMLLSINKKRRLGSVILVVGGFKSRKMERFGVISFMVFERNSGGFLFFFFRCFETPIRCGETHEKSGLTRFSTLTVIFFD